MDAFVARQPIFHKNKKLYAYELLFRTGMSNAFPGVDGETATSSLLSSSFFTVGIELSKHAYELGGNGLFSLFNLLGGVLWLGLMIYFLKDKSVGNSQQG